MARIPKIPKALTSKQMVAAEVRRQANKQRIQGRKARSGRNKQTVTNPKRNAYPGIYDDPRNILERSGGAMAEVNPLMEELFGVTRKDLDDATRAMEPQFTHQQPLPVKQTDRGAPYREQIENKANTSRIRDVLSLAKDDPRLEGSYGWYQMDPLRQAFIDEAGVVDGMRRFDDFLQRGSVLSAGTDVGTEIRRASLAGMLSEQGRINEFIDSPLTSGVKVNEAFPDIFGGDIKEAGKYGHIYHKTSHRPGLKRIEQDGKFYNDKTARDAAKTPAYYNSKTGDNLAFPTADAHFMRALGYPDARAGGDFGRSVDSTEAGHVRDYFRNEVANPIGMEGSPAQALLWNAMAKETGVKSKLSKPYLELITDGIEREAKRLGIPNKQVLSDFIMGRGKLGAYGAGSVNAMMGEEEQPRSLLEM